MGKSSSLIAGYLIEMSKSGYKQQTIWSHARILRLLDKHCNLSDPETVRTYVASAQSSQGRKENLVNV